MRHLKDGFASLPLSVCISLFFLHCELTCSSLFNYVVVYSFLFSLLHMQHHVCTVCERPFQGHLFFERGGRAYCERHFDMVRGLTCCWLLPCASFLPVLLKCPSIFTEFILIKKDHRSTMIRGCRNIKPGPDRSRCRVT